MRITKKCLLKITCCGGLLSGMLAAGSPAAAQSAAIMAMTTEELVAGSAQQPKATAVAALPDSPGAVVSKTQLSAAELGRSGKLPDEPSSVQLLTMRTQSDPQQSESTQSQAQTTPVSRPVSQSPFQKPVGTAAAGAISADGIAASQPDGVAIAPGKQRRVRTIVLRMGAIVGAGVAIGSVVALTLATSGKPPGAH
jgi:hypothetical protein